MKDETLHHLLCDRALGELPPQTAELLEAYLKLKPDVAIEAGRIRRTVELAARACVTERCESLPEPRWQGATERARLPRLLRLGRLCLPYAASAALGLWAGREWRTVAEGDLAPSPEHRAEGAAVQSSGAVPLAVAASTGRGTERAGNQFWTLNNPMVGHSPGITRRGNLLRRHGLWGNQSEER